MRFLPLPLIDFAPRERLLWTCGGLGALVWLLGRPPIVMPSWSVVWLLLGAPVVEEVIFRLGLHQELLTRLRSAPTANVLTALAFAMAHGLTQGTWQSLLTGLPALAIGFIYQRSRRLAPCIAVHASFNAIWLLGPSLTS
jgi:membrane protease YdiL (CAAX protease family)